MEGLEVVLRQSQLLHTYLTRIKAFNPLEEDTEIPPLETDQLQAWIKLVHALERFILLHEDMT